MKLDPNDWYFETWPQNPKIKGAMLTGKIEVGIRAVHLPSGIEVTCDQYRSQIQNRDWCINTIIEQLKDRG